jgi:predicted enzyme related to lactoylglutathione lyase
MAIIGVHALVYSKAANEARAFFRDVLGLQTVDAGHGWLIFGLPPAELGVHPSEDGEVHHTIHLMCDDVHATMKELQAKGVRFSQPITDQGYGLVTSIAMPGGGELGLYQPRHPTAIAR